MAGSPTVSMQQTAQLSVSAFWGGVHLWPFLGPNAVAIAVHLALYLQAVINLAIDSSFFFRVYNILV